MSPKTDKLVTVVVACAGQLEFTRLCVAGLLRFSRPPVEFLFLDSDSLDGTREYLDGIATAAHHRVEVVNVSATPEESRLRRDESVTVRGEYLALLNNDVIVTQAWLESLTAVASADPAIGLVAPMSNFTAPELQLSPEGYHLDEPAVDLGRAAGLALVEKVNQFARPWAEKNSGQWNPVEQVAGGCALLRREMLNRLGAFPTRTPLGTFDLPGLAIKVRQAGFKLAACKGLFVHYFGTRFAQRRNAIP